MASPTPRNSESTAVVWSPSPTRMPTCPPTSPRSVRDRHPRQDQRGHRERGGPPEPDARCRPTAACRPPRATAVSTPAATATSRTRPPRSRAQCRPRKPSTSSAGSFTADAQTMRNAPPSRCGSRIRGPPQPHLDAGQHEPDHQRLVVDAADQVEQHERVADAEPQREPDVDPAAPGQPRQRPDDEGEAGQREHAVGEDAEHHVVAGERGDAAADDRGRAGRRARACRARSWGSSGPADRRCPGRPRGRTRRGRCRAASSALWAR